MYQDSTLCIRPNKVKLFIQIHFISHLNHLFLSPTQFQKTVGKDLIRPKMNTKQTCLLKLIVQCLFGSESSLTLLIIPRQFIAIPFSYPFFSFTISGKEQRKNEQCTVDVRNPNLPFEKPNQIYFRFQTFGFQIFGLFGSFDCSVIL